MIIDPQKGEEKLNNVSDCERSKRWGMDWIGFLFPALLATLLVLIILAPLAYLAKLNMPPCIACVDLQMLFNENQKQSIDLMSKSDKPINELQTLMQKRTLDFTQKLSLTMDALGKECDCIIVNKAALLGGTPTDLTPQVRARMQ